MIAILRAGELFNQGGKRGKFNCSKTHFYDEIEPRLEKVKLGPKATAYTARSCDKVIEEGIKAATAERAAAGANPNNR